MKSAVDHYEDHLARIYAWMNGGIDAALADGAAELAMLDIPQGPGHAVDLGAGFGKHAVPLARLGRRVTAVDASAHLLQQLRAQPGAALIATVHEELAALEIDRFRDVDLVLCMGDTLTHLASRDEVSSLLEAATHWLAPGGRIVLTLRDYTRTPQGDTRFIPVRSDAERIHTCFLETQSDEHIVVHDLLHERVDGRWQLRVSSYPKLRLDPEWLRFALERAGLHAVVRPGPRGMVALVATAS